MKIRHHETFQNLEGVRAFNITMDKNKQVDLKDHFLVIDYLDDNDQIWFEIESVNFWLHINFSLYC